MRMRRKRVLREPTPPQNPSTPPDEFRLKGQLHENEQEEGAEGTHSPQNPSTPPVEFRLKGQLHENEQEEGAEGTHSPQNPSMPPDKFRLKGPVSREWGVRISGHNDKVLLRHSRETSFKPIFSGFIVNKMALTGQSHFTVWKISPILSYEITVPPYPAVLENPLV
jgi:hypothetical protein